MNSLRFSVKVSSLLWEPSETENAPVYFLRSSRSRFRKVVALSSSSSGKPREFSWSRLSRSVLDGTERFLTSLKKSTEEAGIDVEGIRMKFSEIIENGGEAICNFLAWNRWEEWKESKVTHPKRIIVLIFYGFSLMICSQRLYGLVRAPFIHHEKMKLTEAYLEALIPDPSPSNIRKFKKGMWRKSMPKGLKMKKYLADSNGILIRDTSFVGEDAWEEDSQHSQDSLTIIIDADDKLNVKEKKYLKTQLQVPDGDTEENATTWRQRLLLWKKILINEKIYEELESLNAKYSVEFDMKDVEKSLREDIVEKEIQNHGSRAFWISKRWWRYRPKLPYLYFLQKLDSSEVAAVVFTEDLKRVYVTMKEGFPLEYVVDIPLDPYMFDMICSAGAEVDLIQKSRGHYFMKVVFALLPGLLILCLIKEIAVLLHLTTNRFIYRKYNQLLDMAYVDNFVLPVQDEDQTQLMSKEVVFGGDVWDLIDEIMIYMQNPLQYYEKEVAFVRGILLSGPPGTGKTLFARALSKASGLPFVFASGAEFTDGERSGMAKINELFSIARRNAPSFVFIDEIDAIAGKHARKDPRKRATFDALIAQLDGEVERTGVDRFSLKQSFIFICATNMPDDLDPQLVRPGRIDRHLHMGFPDAKQRVKIFKLYTSEKQLADDVDFEKLAFRTVGFSGADIKALVNDAVIMSAKKGISEVFQQDIVDALDKQLLERMGLLLTSEEERQCAKKVSFEKRKLLAVHEAGHIVLAHLFPQFDWHAFSQLLPGGKETSISVFHPREEMLERGYTTFGYLMMHMVVAHGGRCAERIVYGGISDAGSDDLEKITKMAREMVISPQNARLGLASVTRRIALRNSLSNPDGDLIRYKWDEPNVVPSEMTVEISELFARELSRYVEETEELAMKGLIENKRALDTVAEMLMGASRITGSEVEEMMNSLSPVMFDDFVESIEIDFLKGGPLPRKERLRYRDLDVYAAPLHRC